MARREEILRAARDLFLEGGLEGFSLRRVAAKVGISAPAIYRHFDGKDDLLRQVVDLGRERFTAYLVRALRGTSPRERLLFTGESYLDFAFEHPQDYQLMFEVWNRLEVGVHSPKREGNAPMFQFLVDRVRECLPQEAEPSVAFEHALLFWAQCHGLASLYLRGGGSAIMPLEAYRGLSTKLLLRLMDGVLE